jgi:hypothetical protein
MSEFTREILAAYLDDSLSTTETAAVERALRDSDELRQRLKQILGELDRGEHSVGSIWRRERLSCPSREQLGAFLLQALDSDFQDYIAFHLEVIGCPFCQANREDLQSLQKNTAPDTKKRRKRIFDSCMGALQSNKETK